MSQDVERVELPDGQWWDLRRVVTRGMRKAFDVALRQALGPLQAEAAKLEGVERMGYLRAHSAEINLSGLEDAYLLHGTESLSVMDPEGATVERLDQAALDALPDEMVQAVLARARLLYEPTPGGTLKNGSAPPPKQP